MLFTSKLIDFLWGIDQALFTSKKTKRNETSTYCNSSINIIFWSSSYSSSVGYTSLKTSSEAMILTVMNAMILSVSLVNFVTLYVLRTQNRQAKKVYLSNIYCAEKPEKLRTSAPGLRGGVLPYLGCTGMCHWTGHGFLALLSQTGYTIWLPSVLNRFKTCPKLGMVLRAKRLL